ncbi:hypothetical protein QYM36_009230 [Artemia franciscana]|uniref:DDE-1 domain-containing protein n=1 Tax=Artemia franciscana TaxID=6661 RepID=A0AA88L564_ARTSF|nr:hypothetical protein QYM36_009230 [Artemia franciscana]
MIVFRKFYRINSEQASQTATPVGLILLTEELWGRTTSYVTIPAINLAKSFEIHLLMFHPYSSHKIQPLDRSVFGPVKSFCNIAVNDWILTPRSAASSVGLAYPKAFCQTNIVNGSKLARLVPFSENIFMEDEFSSLTVTDRPLLVAENLNQNREETLEATDFSYKNVTEICFTTDD